MTAPINPLEEELEPVRSDDDVTERYLTFTQVSVGGTMACRSSQWKRSVASYQFRRIARRVSASTRRR